MDRNSLERKWDQEELEKLWRFLSHYQKRREQEGVEELIAFLCARLMQIHLNG